MEGKKQLCFSKHPPFFINLNMWVNSLNEIAQGLVAFAKAGGKAKVKEAKDMLESLKRKDIIWELCPLLQ